MEHKRWMQIEDVLQQALDLAPSERTAFLKQFCVADPTLLANVEALLDRESEARSFMESPAVASLLPQTSIDPQSQKPQISRYRIEARIGAGGMAGGWGGRSVREVVGAARYGGTPRDTAVRC